MNTTFKVGTAYTTGEARDYIWRYMVTARTAKFITIRDLMTGEIRRVGVRVWNGTECALPLGSYSMAPSIDAEKEFS